MRIGHVNLENEVLVVAEIGNNHEGNFATAQELVRRAAGCGVQAVKFQTFRTELYVSHSDEVRFARLKSFELSSRQFGELSLLAHSLGLLFISTPFDLVSAAELEESVDAYKIASGDNNFYPLLAAVARTGIPVIISTGVSAADHVVRIVSFVRDRWAERGISGQLAILHCVSSYPTPPAEANLRSISYLAETLGCVVGYSDHTVGPDAAPLAVALGARIIEKHFTLDRRHSDFRDHQLSADPAQMREIVSRVRVAATMLGARAKQMQPCEEATATAVRRSIVAAADFPAGRRLTESDLTWVRPAGGLAPGQEHLLLGKTLKRSVRFGETLRPCDVE